MPFCAFCEGDVELVREIAWTGSEYAEADFVAVYACLTPDCENDGGRMWETERGHVVHLEGVC